MHTRSIDTTNAKQLINICPKLLPPTSSQAFVVVDLCCCRANTDREATEHNQPTSNFAYQAFLHSHFHWYYSIGVKVSWATGITIHSKYTTYNTHLSKWNYNSFVLFRERYSVVGESDLARAKYLHSTLVPRSCLEEVYWMKEPASQPAFSWTLVYILNS